LQPGQAARLLGSAAVTQRSPDSFAGSGRGSYLAGILAIMAAAESAGGHEINAHVGSGGF
jgi:hypothetical protein